MRVGDIETSVVVTARPDTIPSRRTGEKTRAESVGLAEAEAGVRLLKTVSSRVDDWVIGTWGGVGFEL